MRTKNLIIAILTALSVLAASVVYAGGKVNINTASKRKLERLPGVGEDIAELIISYRRSKGSFGSVDELKNIIGIGERRFEAIKDKVTVGLL